MRSDRYRARTDIPDDAVGRIEYETRVPARPTSGSADLRRRSASSARRHPCWRMNLAAEHVVVVAHDDAVLGVDDFALVAFDVEYDVGWVSLLDRFNEPSLILLSNLLCATVRKVRPRESM